MNNIINITYGATDNADYRVLKLRNSKGKVKIIKYKSLIDHWNESTMPREFLYFEESYLDCVAAIGKSIDVNVEFDISEIPQNIINKIIEEYKKSDSN